MEEKKLKFIEKRNDDEFSIVKEAMDAAHCTVKAIIKAKPIEDAIQSDDRDNAISVLITFISKYEKFINLLEPVTGKRVVYQENYYLDKSEFVIKQDLKFLRTIVYADEAKNYGLQKAIETGLKKISKKYENMEQEL